MKRIFTLLLAIGTITVASAQSRDSYSRNSGSSSNVSLYESNRDRDAQIRKVNFDFDKKIADVKRDRWMKNRDKNKQVKLLEKQRAESIARINEYFAKQNRHYDNRNSRDRRW